MKNDYDLVIVGGGHAGAHLLNTLHRKKYTGSVALISDENVAPYHRPPLSKECLTPDTLKVKPLLLGGVHQNENINIMLDTRVTGGSSAEKTLTLSNGNTLSYHNLVIATGSSPRALDVPGARLQGVLSLKTLEDAKLIRNQLESMHDLVLVGGGFINLELAFSLSAPGRNITILERCDRILQRAVSPEISTYLSNKAREAGIHILTGEQVEQLQGHEGAVSGVTTLSGKQFPANCVIVAVGSEPELTLAKTLGLDCNNGLRINKDLQVAPGIYAMGDCVSFPGPDEQNHMRLESVQNATDQAEYIASSLLGESQSGYQAVPWFWSIQGSNRLQMTGLWRPGLAAVVCENIDPAASGFSFYHYDGKQLVSVESLNSPGEHLLARKMLAAGYSPEIDSVKAGFACVKSDFEEQLAVSQ
ncbi:MAG: oxidoreductase [Alcaligenaceae bacterium]|nr:oxidoreductase [Alcaligenaceae bacterium]